MPLFIACSGRLNVAKYLIANGANVNITKVSFKYLSIKFYRYGIQR